MTGEIDAKNERGDLEWIQNCNFSKALSLLAAYHITKREKKKSKRDLDDRLKLVSTGRSILSTINILFNVLILLILYIYIFCFIFQVV